MLVDAVREFALRAGPAGGDGGRRGLRHPAELLATATELGLAALGVPEAHGGVLEHRSTVTAALIAEALAEGDMGIALACLAPAGVATALGLWGDADTTGRLSPGVCRRRAAGRRDRASPSRACCSTRSRSRPAPQRTPDGDFVLDGAKALVPRAAEAELLIVAAELDGAPSLFLVESGDLRGHRRARARDGGPRRRDGPRHARSSAKLPAGALLGDSDPQVYRELVALGRLGWCALAVGTGQAVLDYVSEYVNQRVAFGEPISNRQSVAFMVANIAIELEALRLVDLSRGWAGGDRPRLHPRGGTGARAGRRSTRCRSAPTACSCSAATATPRSTPSSAGTGTCGPPGCMEGALAL